MLIICPSFSAAPRTRHSVATSRSTLASDSTGGASSAADTPAGVAHVSGDPPRCKMGASPPEIPDLPPSLARAACANVPAPSPTARPAGQTGQDPPNDTPLHPWVTPKLNLPPRTDSGGTRGLLLPQCSPIFPRTPTRTPCTPLDPHGSTSHPPPGLTLVPPPASGRTGGVGPGAPVPGTSEAEQPPQPGSGHRPLPGPVAELRGDAEVGGVW